MSEKQSDVKGLIEKMRTKMEKRKCKTEAIPTRRTRKKAQKIRRTDESEKQP